MKKQFLIPLIVGLPIILIVGAFMLKGERVILSQSSEQEKLTEFAANTNSPNNTSAVPPSTATVAGAAQKSDNLLGVSTEDLDPKTMTTPPEMQIAKDKKYSAVLKTAAGSINVELNASATPITVNNFVFLARKGFYDNTIFHRTIKGFMIQGGDPKGDGTGGPGYKFNDEPFGGDYMRGTLAMANAGPNTNGSQFFIMHADYPLSKNYVIFGRVTSGMEVVDKIAEAPTLPGGEGSRPVNPVKVSSVEILEQ